MHEIQDVLRQVSELNIKIKIIEEEIEIQTEILKALFEARGFWFEPSDWKNVEITGYFKLNESVDDEYSTYSRSIWHNRTHNGCGGSDYKPKLHFDGSVTFDKEEWHVRYSDQPKPSWIAGA